MPWVVDGRGRRGIAALLLALLLSASASAQEIRERDVIYLKEGGDPLVGLILSDPEASSVRIRLDNGVETELSRDKIDRIVPRRNAREAYEDAAAKLGGGDADGHAKLALWCFDHELFEEAGIELEAALKADPARRDAYELGVRLELERLEGTLPGLGREEVQDRLLGVVTRARANEAWSPFMGVAEGKVLASLGLSDSARSAFAEVLEALQDELSVAQRELARQARIGLALALLECDDAAAAEAAMTALLEAQPGDFQGLYQRGRARLALGQAETAEADFSAALAVEEAVTEVYIDRAQARSQRGNLEGAAADLARAAELGGRDGEDDDPRLSTAAIRTRLGLVRMRQGKLKSAVNAFVAARGEGGYPPAELGLVFVKIWRGEYQEALDRLAGVESALPGDPVVFAARGQALRGLGRLEESNRAWSEALRLGIDGRIGLRAMADLAGATGKDGRSIQWLRYLTADSGAASADDLYRLGRMQLKAEDVEAARRSFEAALELGGEHVPALNGLGYIAYSQGDYETASGLFSRVQIVDATNEYASRALRNIRESRTRKVWVDDFKREGPAVANRWKEQVGFGIDVKLSPGVVRFSGTQSNEDYGKTTIERRVDDGELVRFEATLDAAKAGQARVGLRVALTNGAEVILFRDGDGKKTLVGSKKAKNDEMTITELGPWPGDDAPRTLAIEVEDLKRGLVGFSIDGERLGELEVQTFKRLRPADVVVYGQASKGRVWELAVSRVRVFVKKEGGEAANPDDKGNY